MKKEVVGSSVKTVKHRESRFINKCKNNDRMGRCKDKDAKQCYKYICRQLVEANIFKFYFFSITTGPFFSDLFVALSELIIFTSSTCLHGK